MPPAALHSSNAMRIEAAALAPCTAVTPDRSVIMPMMISVSETPRWAAWARPSRAGEASSPAAPASTDRRVVAVVLVIGESLPVAAGLCPVRRIVSGTPDHRRWGYAAHLTLVQQSAGEIDGLRQGRVVGPAGTVTAI